jgi:hypothetical protein
MSRFILVLKELFLFRFKGTYGPRSSTTLVLDTSTLNLHHVRLILKMYPQHSRFKWRKRR